jgi:hypothetical protein
MVQVGHATQDSPVSGYSCWKYTSTIERQQAYLTEPDLTEPP